jgi:plasmid segregation protein ParM
MSDASTITPIPVGLDDGYAYTKLALPDGRLILEKSVETRLNC